MVRSTFTILFAYLISITLAGNYVSEQDNDISACGRGYFTCANGRCLQPSLICDGVNNCKDGSDEIDCAPIDQYSTSRSSRRAVAQASPSTYVRCKANEFRCETGNCISVDARCDGFQDCPRGDDEVGCIRKRATCPDRKFSCDGGQQCIPFVWVCDGRADCKDKTDEDLCDKTKDDGSKSCGSKGFRCASTNECIHRELVCNGAKDCKDGSDEGDGCHGCSTAKGGCDHRCISDPSGPICACPEGMRLNADGHSCSDIDECLERTSGCDHGCVNLPDGLPFTCNCASGYDLESDKKTCTPQSHTGQLLFTVGHEIRSVPLFGLDPHASQPPPFTVKAESHKGKMVGLDYLMSKKTFFYTDHNNGVIYAQAGETECLVEGVTQAVAIAVDWITGNIYYVQDRPAEISMCTKDGRFCRTLITEESMRPRGLVLHPKRSLLFWTDWGEEPMIGRAFMDGSNVTTIVSEKLGWPNGLAIDYAREQLYWIDASLQLIEACDIDGRNRQVLVSKGLHHPFDLVAFDHRVFWSDWATKSIYAVDIRNASHRQLLHSADTKPFGLTIASLAHQESDIANPCERKRCSHMCALGRNGQASCVCPNHYELAPQSRTNCIPSHTSTLRSDEESDNQSPHLCRASWQNQCANGICQNGGSCQTMDESHVECRCKDGFVGLFCEVESTESTSTSAPTTTVSSRSSRHSTTTTKKPTTTRPRTSTSSRRPKTTTTPYAACDNGKFPCDSDRQCVPFTFVCDGHPDCMDGSDESFCSGPDVLTIMACGTNHFRCTATKECIRRELLCDGEKDCDDGSDEDSSWCHICQESNGGCEHRCTPDPHGPVCSCPIGTRLNLEDGKSCIDVDECLEGISGCDHTCQNSPDGFVCTCAVGYELEADGRTCRPKERNGQLLFTVGHEIRNVALFRTRTSEPPEHGVMIESRKGKIVGLDFNYHTTQYYYTDHDNGRIYAQGTTSQCLVEGLSFPQNVAVDWVTGNIYFANDKPGEIGMCTTDGRFCRTLIAEEVMRPRGLVLHPKRHLLFWTDWGEEPMIGRAFMDGSNATAIVSEKLGWPNGLAIDYAREQLYWIDASLQLIERCDLYGQNRRMVVSKGLHHPFDLAVFDHRIFWSDWVSKSITSVDTRNASTREILHTTKTQPFGLTIASPAHQEAGIPNPCASKSCSHMCALGAEGATCLCPDGYEFGHKNPEACAPSSTAFIDFGSNHHRLCSDAWLERCTAGLCQNGGHCYSASEKDLDCRCKEGFSGIFCEVDDGLMLGRASSAQVSSRAGLFAGLLIACAFLVLILAALCYVYRQSVQQALASHNAKLLMSPSVVFRKAAHPRSSARSEHRERIIEHEGGTGTPDYSRVESFANPVYVHENMEVRRPLLQLRTESSPELQKLDASSDTDSALCDCATDSPAGSAYSGDAEMAGMHSRRY